MIEKIRIAELTSEEARQELTSEAVVLLPMGSLEDQGIHAPMGDYMAADLMAMEIAKTAREDGVPTFVAPVIPFGGKDYFESSHGGMASSMSPTLAQSLREVKRLMANGSKRRPFYDDDQAFIDAQKLTLGVLKEQMDEE